MPTESPGGVHFITAADALRGEASERSLARFARSARMSAKPLGLIVARMTEPKIIGSAPILLVRDVVASANYYRDKVGFSYERFWGEPPCFCILWRNNFHLMLRQVEDPKAIVPHYKVVESLWNVYFWVDDAHALYEELKRRGATIDYELCDQPYGCREFGIQDLDGYDIAFGQNMDAPANRDG